MTYTEKSNIFVLCVIIHIGALFREALNVCNSNKGTSAGRVIEIIRKYLFSKATNCHLHN